VFQGGKPASHKFWTHPVRSSLFQYHLLGPHCLSQHILLSSKVRDTGTAGMWVIVLKRNELVVGVCLRHADRRTTVYRIQCPCVPSTFQVFGAAPHLGCCLLRSWTTARVFLQQLVNEMLAPHTHLGELWMTFEGNFILHCPCEHRDHVATCKWQFATEHEVQRDSCTEAVNFDPIWFSTNDLRSYIARGSTTPAHCLSIRD